MELLRSPKWGRPEPDMTPPPGFSAVARPRREGQSRAMLFLNPPDHTRLRSLVSRAFTPRRIEEMRSSMGEILGPILDDLADKGSVDVMADLAFPFPVTVISELLGVPRSDDTDRFRDLVRRSTANIDPSSDEEALQAADAAIMEMAAYFFDLIEQKRKAPDDRLLSALIEVEEKGDRLSPEELIANTLLLYAAGFETTSNLIGNGLWALLRHPDQMALLRSEPDLVPAAVWEILRWDSPVQLNGRTALVDTELFGEPVPRGASTMILQGSGNRDEEVYDDPDSFDVRRFTAAGVPQPLSFGWGAHHCLGAHLARAEGEEVLRALLGRFTTIELAGPTPRYRASFTLRGLEALPLRFS